MSEAPTKSSSDSYTAKLKEQKERLEQCQASRSLTSCLACESVVGCPTRTAYVKAVYESMSKGQGGGFDF